MEEVYAFLANAKDLYINVYIGLLRYVAPALAAFLLWRCLKPLMFFKREPEIWAWLYLENGMKYALTHWENVVGRSKSSDVHIDLSTVSRNHAVLTRYDDGSWTVTDANSKSGVLVNGSPVQICALEEDDVITIGGLDMVLKPISHKQERLMAQLRTREGSGLDSVANVLILSIFQCLCCLGFLLGGQIGIFTVAAAFFLGPVISAIAAKFKPWFN